MAKRARRTSTGSGAMGLRRTSGLLRHTNSQAFGANAATAIGEAIDNPAFGRGGVHTGMEIARILVMPAVAAVDFFSPASGNLMIHQIQIGDQSGTPAALDPNDEALFAHIHMQNGLVTSGGAFGPVYPMNIPIINVVPVIIEQFFTVVHQGANVANVNNETLFTIIDYFTVEVPDNVYTQIALSRRDQS